MGPADWRRWRPAIKDGSIHHDALVLVLQQGVACVVFDTGPQLFSLIE
jgi:hypothetical protein